MKEARPQYYIGIIEYILRQQGHGYKSKMYNWFQKVLRERNINKFYSNACTALLHTRELGAALDKLQIELDKEADDRKRQDTELDKLERLYQTVLKHEISSVSFLEFIQKHINLPTAAGWEQIENQLFKNKFSSNQWKRKALCNGYEFNIELEPGTRILLKVIPGSPSTVSVRLFHDQTPKSPDPSMILYHKEQADNFSQQMLLIDKFIEDCRSEWKMLSTREEPMTIGELFENFNTNAPFEVVYPEFFGITTTHKVIFRMSAVVFNETMPRDIIEAVEKYLSSDKDSLVVMKTRNNTAYLVLHTIGEDEETWSFLSLVKEVGKA